MATDKKETPEVEEETKSKGKKTRRRFYDITRGIHRLLPCIFLTLGVMLGVFYAFGAVGRNAAVTDWFLGVIFGLFGKVAYAIPALLIIIGVRWRSDIERERAISRIVYYTLLLIMIEAIIWCFTADKSLSYSISFYYQSGIGVFGGSIAHLLYHLTSYAGVPILSTALIGMFFYHFLELTPHKILSFFRKKRDHGTSDEAVNADEDESDAKAETEKAAEEKNKPAKKEKPNKRKNKKGEDAPAYDGYFPDAAGEESFGDIRRRMEREAQEIERERAREEIISHNNAVTAGETPTQETSVAPVEEESDGEEGYFTAPAAGEPLSPAAQESSAIPPAQSADALFGTFDPLSGDAVINTTTTILRPAGAPAEVKRESVRPVTATREEYHTVPGGVQGGGENVGSFCIRPTPHKTAPRPAPAAQATVAPEPTVEETPAEGRPLEDFELLTRRTDNEIQVSPSLPYVHPATQPSTQPQPEPVVTQPQGYPYPAPGNPYPMAGNPYGQMPYPPAPYPGYPTQPYAPYPYPNYAYPPQAAPATPYPPQPQPSADPVQSPQASAPADIPITRHTEVTDEPAVEATAHVVDHHINDTTPVTRPATPQKQESAPRKAPTYTNYHFPPVSLLESSVNITNYNTESEVNETKNRLVGEFRKFKINIEVKDVTIGPRVTRYSIAPPDGVRMNTLIGLANDIALGLAVKSIRIEPVPNTPYLGVEIPNKTPTTVRLASLIDTENFRNTKTVTTIPIGASVTGQPVFADIAKMPHVLIAGATGMGKSVFMNSLLLSLLYKARPDDVKLILVDPKRVELSVYNGIPHLIIPTVVEPQKAAGALIWAVGEMERRYHLMEKYNTRSIESYNNAAREDPSIGEVQPKIIIVIDELNDLMMQARDAVEPAIMSIAQKARAAGIYLIIGTQRPSVDVITGVIKANIPSRIAFHVSSGTDSRTILDTYGAEKLLNNGDMLACIGGAEPIRVQGAFVADEEVERVTKFLKDNAGPAVYDEVINAQIESETEKYKNSGKRQSDRDTEDEDMDGSIFEDSVFMRACEVAFTDGKVSTSLLQRRCSIGYGKAAKYIDIMQSMGIVSAPDGQKPREVLMSRDQFMEMVSRESYTDDD